MTINEADDVRMVACTREEYAAVVAAAGGIDCLSPISSYTRVDGDQWGPGKRIDTVWGTPDGEPVCESSCRNDGTQPADEWMFWKAVKP